MLFLFVLVLPNNPPSLPCPPRLLTHQLTISVEALSCSYTMTKTPEILRCIGTGLDNPPEMMTSKPEVVDDEAKHTHSKTGGAGRKDVSVEAKDNDKVLCTAITSSGQHLLTSWQDEAGGSNQGNDSDGKVPVEGSSCS